MIEKRSGPPMYRCPVCELECDAQVMDAHNREARRKEHIIAMALLQDYMVGDIKALGDAEILKEIGAKSYDEVVSLWMSFSLLNQEIDIVKAVEIQVKSVQLGCKY